MRIKRRLEGILIANKYSMLEYNIPAASLKEAEKITPGYEAPTVSELDEAGWFAVKVMVEKDKVADAMERLEDIGATALIETEIKKIDESLKVVSVFLDRLRQQLGAPEATRVLH